MQTKIIKKFRELHVGMTLRTMSDITGIQVTRLFRIINGAEMKLVEYQKLQFAIHKKSESELFNLDINRADILELTEIYLDMLATESIQDLNLFLKSRIFGNGDLLSATS